MRRSPLPAAVLSFATVAFLAVPVAAQQQPTSPAANSERSLQIDGYLQRGREIEAKRHWGEALVNYEEGLRLFPEDNSLAKCFDFARLHYDLGRRCADRSFTEKVTRISTEKALDLYLKVLSKIETHYVEQPVLKDLVARGTADLETALSDPVFLDRYFPRRRPAEVEAFRRELHQMMDDRGAANRMEARDSALLAANLAQQRLGLAPTVAVLEYLCGATNALDPYSYYLTPDQLSEVYCQIDGRFVGLGVELKAQGGNLMIVHVIRGSPADRAGAKAGDQIIAIDGYETSRYTTDQAAIFLQGPEGSICNLVLSTAGQADRGLAVRRQPVVVPSVDQVHILDAEQGVGYVRLTCFQKSTRRELEAALSRLHRDGMRSLIADLRGNPGGLLTSAVECTNLFLDSGVIVSTRGRIAQEDSTYTAHPEGVWHMPLTVVIDHKSASAAEIFSGAIQDHRRGTIVGVRSFGRGSVQGIFQLDGFDSGLRLTTAKFYSPHGKTYSHLGVQPDVVVHETARPVNGAIAGKRDAMLDAALQSARNAAMPR